MFFPSKSIGKLMHVQVMLKAPEFYSPTGEMFFAESGMTFSNLETRDESDCPHTETICADCAESWSCDYWIIVTDGFTSVGLNDVPGIRNI